MISYCSHRWEGTKNCSDKRCFINRRTKSTEQHFLFIFEMTMKYLIITCFLLSILYLRPTSSTTGTKFSDLLSPFNLYAYSGDNGPSNWGVLSDTCDGGMHQSPINLTTTGSIRAEMPSMKWQGHWTERKEGFVMKNTWHSAEIAYTGEQPVINGGPLLDDYILSQVHFHWGTQAGSEHAIDGLFYDMEAHLVHYKSEYGDVTIASEQPDGLAVIGLFFKVSKENNTGLDGIVSGLRDIRQGGSFTNITSNSMNWILEHATTNKYFTYQGSLTTPPCSEIVTWVVIDHVENVGERQISEFQKLQGEHGEILDNHRPVQPLNGRQIFYCSNSSVIHLNYHLLLVIFSSFVYKYFTS